MIQEGGRPELDREITEKLKHVLCKPHREPYPFLTREDRRSAPSRLEIRQRSGGCDLVCRLVVSVVKAVLYLACNHTLGRLDSE